MSDNGATPTTSRADDPSLLVRDEDPGTSPDAGRCPNCEGRGWKVVTAFRVVPVAERPVAVAQGGCLDCAGTGKVAAQSSGFRS